MSNPIFDLSLPFSMPAFDRIEDHHFSDGFDAGMKSHRSEIKAIAEQTEAPTFVNTIEAMEKAGAQLDRLARIFFNLTNAHTNDNLEALQRLVAPQLAQHRDCIMLDHQLFKRISTLYDTRDSLNLDHESERLLQRYFRDFVRAGANLDVQKKERLKAINAELASLSTRFSQNVLKATNNASLLVARREQLAGLSPAEIEQAAQAAADLGHSGQFALAVTNTTEQPLESVLTDRTTRRAFRDASINRCLSGEFDNRQVVLDTARLRAERARLLGYVNHAAYVLEDETAQSTDAVNALLSSLAPRAAANAAREAQVLQKCLEADGERFKLEASDWSFYAERVKREQYAFDESQIRPYLELERVLQDGLFFAATRLYGITFKERFDLPLYHPDVRTFDVSNADGSSLALLLTDFYARPSKRGGAWMNEYVGCSKMNGTLPVVGNHLNVPKPAEGSPTLLTLAELTTLFHEFGHALHGMFSNVQYPRFAGTRVPRDFVEFPSQINEMWAMWPEVFANYAKHWQTGEPLPQALYQKVLDSDKFNQGFATTEYLAAAILDQAWHQLSLEQIPAEVVRFEDDTLKQQGIWLAEVAPRYRTCYFSHIFAGGYGAGYYAYIWSEVLDADAGDWFREHAGLDRKNGDWFRETLLSRGGSQDAALLYRTFRGRDAAPEALLIRRGLNLDDSLVAEVGD